MPRLCCSSSLGGWPSATPHDPRRTVAVADAPVALFVPSDHDLEGAVHGAVAGRILSACHHPQDIGALGRNLALLVQLFAVAKRAAVEDKGLTARLHHGQQHHRATLGIGALAAARGEPSSRAAAKIKGRMGLP